MSRAPRILIIDDHPADAAAFSASAREAGFDVECATDSASGLEKALAGGFDIVLSDLVFDDGGDGMDIVSRLRSRHPHLPVIVATGQGGSDAAIGAIRRGAFDFLLKPVSRDDLTRSLGQALEAAHRMRKPVASGPSAAAGDGADDSDLLIGESSAMITLYKDLGRVSATPATVLIRGETGTGKELIARAIYQHGHRAHQPFVAINCAAIPPNLLESELFGHERGAFTGADRARVGRFEQAHNATLFLDEIGDLDLPLQAKLLRVLQDRQIRRVGGNVDIPVDVRIIAATHRNLEEMMATGEFREDLFYRLNVASIEVPPLRHRTEDIEMLVSYFIGGAAREYGLDSISIASEAVDFLRQQPWPGNVRQLQNVIRKAVIRSHGYTIGRADVLELLADSRQPGSAGAGGADDSVRELIGTKLRSARATGSGNAYRNVIETVERRLFQRTLELTRGNQAKAARWLGISRFTLREKLRQFGIHPGENGSEDRERLP